MIVKEQRSIWAILYGYKIHHIVMWLLYFAFFSFMYRATYPTFLSLIISVAIFFVFNAVAFYIIGYYLFPRFLYKGKYGAFLLTATILCLGLTGILTSVIYALFWKYIPKEVASVSMLFQLSFISVVPLAGFMSGGKLVVDKIKSDRVARQMERQRVEAELQYLKAQVNPHFLFNAINSVYFLIKKDPGLAAETLIKLSDLLRFQLYDCSDEKIAIEKEIEYLTNFIALEKIRKGDKVKIGFHMNGNLSGFEISPFLLIPFLENAFKYVSTFNDRDNVIDLHLDREGDKLVARFSNTSDNIIKNEVGGIGHRNVMRRLDLLYPKKHELRLEDLNGSYSVYLSIDIA